MDRLESRFEKRCIEQLKALPKSWWPDKAPSGAIVGLPDRTGCINGRFISLEFKRNRTAATAELQKYNAIKIRHAGGRSFFVYPENWEEIFNKLKELSK